jgi:GntR family transcriptional regulator
VVDTTQRLHSTKPLYRQIQREILACLALGEWKPGAQLPTESELADRFAVAIFTVRAAVGHLVAAGILARRQGKGTFVAQHERDRRRQKYSKVFDYERRKPVLTHKDIANFRKRRADDRAMYLLRLDPQKSLVYCWETILKENDHVIGIRSICVPAHLFSGLTVQVLREHKQNMYALYQDLCGVNVIRMEDCVRAGKADARRAKLLGIRRGDPLLHVERIAFTYNDMPIELRNRFFDGSRYQYQADQLGS